MPHPPTYDHLHSHFLPKKEVKKKLVTYKKYLMSLITILNSGRQLGRPKLIQILIFWFEEFVISLYNYFKHIPKTYNFVVQK